MAKEKRAKLREISYYRTLNPAFGNQTMVAADNFNFSSSLMKYQTFNE